MAMLRTISLAARRKLSRRHDDTTDIELEDFSRVDRQFDTQPTTSRAASAQWRHLFGFTAPLDHVLLTASLCTAVASGGVSPVLSVLLGRLFDQFTDFANLKLPPSHFTANVAHFSTYIAYLGLACFLLNGGRYSLWLLFGESQARNARLGLFRGLRARSCEWFDLQSSGTGSVLSRAQTYIRELQLATAQPMGAVVSAVTTAVASIVIAFSHQWKLTLVILATIPITALILGVVSNKTQPFIRRQQQHLQSASNSAQNALRNRDSVKCYNGEAVEINRYSLSIDRAAKSFTVQSLANAAETGFVRFAVMLSFVQGFWYGQHLAAMSEASFGTIVTTFWSCFAATQALESILPQLLVFEKGRAAGDVLLSLSATTVPTPHPNQYDSPQQAYAQEPIQLQGVTFAYPTRSEIPALRNFSCTFPGGRISYLIGKSGSGKSTIPQLLLRFYHSYTGSISLGETPIEDIDIPLLRETITLVEQDSVLFAGSIKHNIELGAPEITPIFELLRAAVLFVSLQDTIERLPHGFRTLVGEGGENLSGGQRQRVAIARARLRSSPILIMDESTSALDVSSRIKVMAAIRKWRQGKTTIIISHDWTQIEDADFVCLVENGEKVAEGSGRSLLQSLGQADRSENNRSALRSQHEHNPTAVMLGHDNDDAAAKSHGLHALPERRTGNEDPILSRVSNAYAHSPAASLPLLRGSNRCDSPTVPSILMKPHGLSTPPSPDENPTSAPAQSLQPYQTSMSKAVTNHPKLQRAARLIRRSGSAYPKLPSKDAQKMTDLSRLSLWHILRTVLPSISPSACYMLLFGFLGAVVHAIAVPLFSWVFAKLLATFITPWKSSAQHAAVKYAVSIIAIAVADGTALFATLHFLERASQDWIDAHRRRALQKLLDQPKLWFTRPENTHSSLLHVLDRCAEDMRSILGRYCAFIISAVVMMTISVLWGFAVCWKLTLVGLSACPVFFGAAQGFQLSSAKRESMCNRRAEACAAVLHEAFTKLKAVRALTLEDVFADKHTDAVNATFQAGVYRALCCGCFYGLSEAVIILAEALVFYYGAVLVVSRDYSVEQILLIFSLLLFGLSNVAVLVGYIPQIEQSKATAARLLELSRLPSNREEAEGHRVLTQSGSVCIRNLSFADGASATEKTLSEVSLTIPAGKITALVGYSGSGKSTIAALLLRLLPVPHAQPYRSPCITIHGEDINTISVHHLRQMIVLVPQQPVLFPASILENIAYALPVDSPYACLEAIKAAARAAHIHDFIHSLPDGYNTVIGDGGTGLSGGQAQRIELARALVRQPRVLILDEATSALDPASADAVRKTLRRLTKKHATTVLVITHAEEMMEAADRIVMLEQGRVVEEGEFKKLLRKNGKLSRMLSSRA